MAPKIITSYIPVGRKNRPGYKLTVKKITVHNTANKSNGADAAAHATYFKSSNAAAIPASVHFVVDGGRLNGKKTSEIYQLLPLTENGWHCGDGTNGPGNRTSVGVEICENKDGDMAVAEANAAWLVAKLLKDYKLKITDVKQHYDWSKKNCPNVLRGRKNGWANFLKEVERNLNPPKVATPTTKLPVILKTVGIRVNNKNTGLVGYYSDIGTMGILAETYAKTGGEVTGYGDYIDIVPAVTVDTSAIKQLKSEVASLSTKIKAAKTALS